MLLVIHIDLTKIKSKNSEPISTLEISHLYRKQ